MNKWNGKQLLMLALAALTGLAVGLLATDGRLVDESTSAALPENAVAVFSQGQPSFFIAPVATEAPENIPQAAGQSAPSFDPASTQPIATPTPQAPDASAFSIVPLGQSQLSQKGSILIYHTHTYEAYEQGQQNYQETERWRTADPGYNMIRVGEELAQLLRGLGYLVEHDTTAFEPPQLSNAYTRSLAMLEKRAVAGEAYDLYIDLHRDAYVEGQAGANTVSIGGVEAARLMLLIGKGEGYTDAGYDQKPDWEANLACAQRITDGLNEQVPNLCKEVRLKSGRFNQHVAQNCVLIEVGNNRNTLQQALAAMPYLADAIDSALRP